jgi:hypothetical protein
MNKDELYGVFTKMKMMLGADTLLEELFQAMSSQEAQENLEYIDQMCDLGLFPEEEEERHA